MSSGLLLSSFTSCWQSADGQSRLVCGDTFEVLPLLPDRCIDCVWTDPPYFLSNGGFTLSAGRPASVNKGAWDKSQGQTLEGAIIAQQTAIPFEEIGKTLRNWHRVLSETEVPQEVQTSCDGKLDRIRRYQERYATMLGLEKAFNPLFSNGYIDFSEKAGVIQTLVASIEHLNQSEVLLLPRNTWGHGDFKPENIP